MPKKINALESLDIGDIYPQDLSERTSGKEDAFLKEDQDNHHKIKILTYDLDELENLLIQLNSDEKDRFNNIISNIKKHGHHRLFCNHLETVIAQLNKLIKRFPNFSDFIDDVITAAALCKMTNKPFTMNSVLLDGPPGIGKTAVTKAVAQCFNYPFLRFDLSSSQTSARLIGSESFWSNTKPGELFNEIVLKGQPAMFVQLDEIDKVNGDPRYSPSSALYNLLEKSTAQSFTDLSVNRVSIDLSYSVFLGTCNKVELIDAPIRDRMDIYHIKEPSDKQLAIIANNIYADLVKELGLQEYLSKRLSSQVIGKFQEHHQSLSIRVINRSLFKAIGFVVRSKRHRINADDIQLPSQQIKRRIGF